MSLNPNGKRGQVSVGRQAALVFDAKGLLGPTAGASNDCAPAPRAADARAGAQQCPSSRATSPTDAARLSRGMHSGQKAHSLDGSSTSKKSDFARNVQALA